MDEVAKRLQFTSRFVFAQSLDEQEQPIFQLILPSNIIEVVLENVSLCTWEDIVTSINRLLCLLRGLLDRNTFSRYID